MAVFEMCSTAHERDEIQIIQQFQRQVKVNTFIDKAVSLAMGVSAPEFLPACSERSRRSITSTPTSALTSSIKTTSSTSQILTLSRDMLWSGWSQFICLDTSEF